MCPCVIMAFRMAGMAAGALLNTCRVQQLVHKSSTGGVVLLASMITLVVYYWRVDGASRGEWG